MVCSTLETSLGGGINIIEIITFVLVLMAAFIFLKTLCAKRRRKRLDKMHAHLQGISIPDYNPQPPVVRVQPNAARVPIMAAPPPPVYPGNQIAAMEKYDIWWTSPGNNTFTQYLLHNIYSATIFTHTWTEDEPTRLPVSIWTQENLFQFGLKKRTCFNLSSNICWQKDLFQLAIWKIPYDTIL